MKKEIELEKRYTTEDILKIYSEFDKILNDVINTYEEQIKYIYYENTMKNKLKRKIKQILRMR